MSVTLEKIDYGVVKNCLKVGNGTVDLVISTEFGPRILFYGFAGETNLFKNFDLSILLLLATSCTNNSSLASRRFV